MAIFKRPLTDITYDRAISCIFVDGNFLRRESIDQMLTALIEALIFGVQTSAVVARILGTTEKVRSIIKA